MDLSNTGFPWFSECSSTACVLGWEEEALCSWAIPHVGEVRCQENSYGLLPG